MSSTRFTLQLAGLDVQVLAFEAVEAIGQPYTIDVRLVCTRPDLDLAALLRQPAWLAFGDGRGLHGLVWRIEQSQCGRDLSHYRIELRPALAWLEQRRNSRIFEQKSVPQILQHLLAEHGIQGDACRFSLGSPYPARDYCVQYAESDLHFLQRMCEEEGLHYHFRHSDQGHVLVFGDDQTPFPRLETAPICRPGNVGIQRFAVRLETRSDSVTLRDHDFDQPRLDMDSSACAEDTPTAALDLYDYPGRFNDRARGRQLARRALEAARHDRQLASGASDQPNLASGHFLDLRDHPHSDYQQLWLLTEVRHQGYQPQVLEAYADSDATTPQGYRNSFTATLWDVPFRLPRRHARPRLIGSQSAVVTGPANEDIHCDAQGRVQVRFHWEREARDESRAWLRVASGWAGNQYGALAIPRVGMEVLVGFLDGDPDRPLVTGCLYHGEHEPPCPLPEHQTRSVFRTRSSPGGEGFHELHIDDRQGAERIYLHAQRDWQQHIRHDLRLQVGHAQHQTVGGNRYSEIQGEQHSLLHANRLGEVKASDHLTVGKSRHVRLGDGQFIEAAREIHLSSGQKIVMAAGSALTLKAGGSFVKLDASGVTLVGAQVRVNSGGSAGVGSGARPALPEFSQKGEELQPGDSAPSTASSRQSTGPETAAAQSAETAPLSRELIVDVWGDPALGDQLQLLDSREKA
ncbi:type VI secretion system tip protein TssI/VgrG [Pseudomonas sp.]|uniref:type VI secretion system tip protein TssI/VgrG n=1 Tax=Pseudomonas sp. TaxID=306 RepID=UPI0039C9E665